MSDTAKLQRIHSGPRHKLYRGHTVDGAVVIKVTSAEVPTASAVASMRHEYELLNDLDLSGIVKVRGLQRTNEGLALLMEDAGACTLADRIRQRPLSLDEFLEVAVQLAEAIAWLHGARIVHRDISPGHVVWDAERRRATVIGFAIATTLSALTVERDSPSQLEGTLAYISPEQTGRTGRSVDSRTDLYSLGATFYELLTGAPPFPAQDPVELVHAHIARRPRELHEVDGDVPLTLSRIVHKLLEKEPERRYQTAEALAVDLRRARTQWQESGRVAAFALASHDVPRGLSIPDKLYGRATEVRTLEEAFTRACHGQRQLVLVTGAPGIGKSALVSHLGRPVAEHHGLYVAGKFDQLQRSVPFSGLAQAFRALVRQLLTESEPVLAEWRERIQAAVAPNAQLLVDIVPELERVIGPQPPVPELGPVESKNRFLLVFTHFLRVFARAEHPLALFLDDLQWVDAASLQLLEQWATDSASQHLLLLGAYRDGEVGASHPLTLALAGLRDAGCAIAELRVGPIGRDDVAQLAADAFNERVATTQPLAELIMAKTAGNPFFVRRLIHLLHAEGFIHFSPQARAWQWSLEDLARVPLTDNVLDLMVHTIERLPESTRALLQVGACIGHRFDLSTLAEVSGLARTVATGQLWPAIEDGLLVPMREAYKAPRTAGPLDDSLDGLPAVVQFVHDRVQQAAYSLLSEERRRALHLDIGRRLLSGANGQVDERLFDIVDQLDLGEALVVDPQERLRLVELNLAAGRKARVSAAYQAAFTYLTVAKRHLPARVWDDEPALAFALHRELAECAYLNGQHAEAEALIDTALAHAPSKVAQADLYSLRALAATVAGDMNGAIHWGREGLAVFGLAWPLEGLADAIEVEARAIPHNLGDRRIDALVDEPEVEDEETRACMRLLAILGPPAYFVGSPVLPFVVMRAANLSLRHGPSVYSAYAYVFYGAIHNARTGEYDIAYEYGKLALALARRFGNRAEECRTLEVFSLVVHPWKAPLRDSLPLVREGYRAGVESGELAYAAFNLNSVLLNGLPSGMPLTELLVDAEVALEFAHKHGNRACIDITLPFRQLARALRGATRAPTSFDDEQFQEARFIQEAASNQTAMGQFWVARLQVAYLFGDYALARRCSLEAARLTSSGILGMVASAEHVFYTALTLAAELAQTAPGDASLAPLRALQGQLVTWAAHCPANFAHKAALVGAELARLSGAPLDAMRLYRAAVDDAARQQLLQDEALAYELRARFFLGQRELDAATAHLRAARDRYQRWGATAKVQALEVAHPECFAGEPRLPAPTLTIDALGLIKASQAISAETAPDRLFERILRIVVEVAGAQVGALILCERDEWTVRARIAADGGAESLAVSLESTPLDAADDLPATILRYVVRLKESLVLADALADGAFTSDPAVRQRQLRSVLCVPLKKQSRVIGLLYVENGALAGAFGRDLVEVVQVLASQAAISLESSTLLGERDRAEQSARFLAQAGAALVESLDYAGTLTRVVRLAVPAFADLCILDLVAGDEVRRVEVAHAHPAQADLAAALRQFVPSPSGTSTQPAALALRKGRAIVVETVTEAGLRAMAQDDAHLRVLRELRARSIIAVPLVARGRMLGVVSFLSAESSRAYDSADVAIAEELAKRCALALDNASLYEGAQTAIRHRDDFLAIASHELKTPLTPLQLQLHSLERSLPKLGLDDVAAAQLLQKFKLLRRQGDRLERLVNEMLDISRVTDGRLQLAPEAVDLGDLVRDVVGQFEERGELARSKSQIYVEEPGPIVGHWDRLRLEQVVTNLLSNALKYGEGKPVAIRVTASDTTAMVQVVDHGLGIDARYLARIFGRFERAISSRQYSGLGLGLYITRQILEAMHGDVQVTSTLGQGSTFTVTLPLAQRRDDSP